MNNFNSIFEELNKLYEEAPAKVTKKVTTDVAEACKNEKLAEATEDEIEIVDAEAPVEEVPAEEPVAEEARQIVIECSKCGALIVKDEADIVVDEESDLVNVEDKCEFCEESEGFKIIGVMTPYVAIEEEPVEEPVEEVADEEEAIEEEPVEDEEEFIDEELADVVQHAKELKELFDVDVRADGDNAPDVDDDGNDDDTDTREDLA